MPYVSQEARERIAVFLKPATVGELTYLLTMDCLEFLGTDPRFEDYDKVIGSLECAKLELYRRRVAVYEDEAMRRNGDVY